MKPSNKWRDKQPHVGKRVMVHAYKYNGWLYRSWEFPIVILANNDYFVLACEDTLILTDEHNGKRTFKHHKNELFFWIFFKKNWFNIIIEVATDPVSIKVNLASKYFYEESAIKYVDFELDYKANLLGEWKELDRQEFINAVEAFKYPQQLVDLVERNAIIITNAIQSKDINTWMEPKMIDSLMTAYKEVKKHEKPNN